MKKIVLFLIIIAFVACGSKQEMAVCNDSIVNNPEIDIKENPYSLLMDTMLVDGFDFPVGNKDGKGSYVSKFDGVTYPSWYVAAKTAEHYSLGIHTGEDWNGTGGANTDIRQPVYSIARGRVVTAKDYGSPWGGIVLIAHTYLENGEIKQCFSLYAHLDEVFVEQSDIVKKRSKIGTIGTGGGAYLAHLHFEIRKASMEGYVADFWPLSEGKDRRWVLDNYEKPTSFIENHRSISKPSDESTMIIVIKHLYKMYLFSEGKIVNEYEIALSQEPVGHKKTQGDNRMPEGEYMIIQKSRGPFSGDFASFFGVAWMRLNYPNTFDARHGFEQGLINNQQMQSIIEAVKAGKEPSKYTKLGGGVGLHGWAGDWKADGEQNLTWGCISMHNKDLDGFYDLVPLKTKIIIRP